MNRKESILAYSAWGAVCFFWGTTYLAAKIGVQELPITIFIGLRYLIAGSIFFTYSRVRGYAFPRRDEWKHLAIIAFLLLVVANGCVVWAVQWIPSGLAALIITTLPFWVVGFEALQPNGSPLTAKKTLGISIGFIGMVILFGPELKVSFDWLYVKGILATLVASCSWAGGSVYWKHKNISCNATMAAAVEMLMTGVIASLLGISLGEAHNTTFTFSGVAALLYLVVFGSIAGFGSYIYALTKLPTATVSMYAYINPVIAILLGWLILDERLDWNIATATVCILSGVLLVNSSKK